MHLQFKLLTRFDNIFYVLFLFWFQFDPVLSQLDGLRDNTVTEGKFRRLIGFTQILLNCILFSWVDLNT